MKAAGYFTKPLTAWLAGCGCVIALGVAAELTRPYPNLSEVLSNPHAYDGTRLPLIVECRIVEIVAGGFVLEQMGARLQAHTSEKNLTVGEYVAVEGIFHAPDVLEVTRLRVAQNRRLKMAVSLVAVFSAVFLLCRNVGFDRKIGRLFLKKSTHA